MTYNNEHFYAGHIGDFKCKICCSDSGAEDSTCLACNTVWTSQFYGPDRNMEFCRHLVALCVRVGKAEEDRVGISTLK
jgi:hypothetical protein